MLPREALKEAIAGWRKTKNPRFAVVADWATARALAAEPPRPLVGKSKKQADVEAWIELLEEGDALDLPRLLGTVGGGTSAIAAERLAMLSKLNDPRVTTGVLALLIAPPYRARTALRFFRACVKVLQDSGDPRVRARLEELAARYKSILETSVGDDVTAILRRAALSLDQVKPAPLPAALEKKCAALEALFEVERRQSERGAVKQKAAKYDDDALLAAIYAAPDDDSPRMVFADALTERGDLRGEFIALQLARAKGKATPAQLTRERELCVDSKRRAAWSLPLSQGSTCHVARGFPDSMIVEPRTFKSIVGIAAARTLDSVSGFEREVSVKQAKTFLQHENAARVREIGGLTEELFGALETLPWRAVGLAFLPTAEQLSRMPNLRALSLSDASLWTARGTGLPEETFEGLTSLEKLVICDLTGTGQVLAHLTGLVELEVLDWAPDADWAKQLGKLPKLERLDLGSNATAKQVAGLQLKALTLHFTPDFKPNALIDALPKLEELRVDDGDHRAMAKLLASSRLKQLRFASVGNFELTKPWTPEGTLELRSWDGKDYEKHAKTMALLPEGCVSKVSLRPLIADPWTPAGPPPSNAAVKAIQASTKIPVELVWC